MSPVVIGSFAMIDAAVLAQMAYAARDLREHEEDEDAE
jgi:hypothetical protein